MPNQEPGRSAGAAQYLGAISQAAKRWAVEHNELPARVTIREDHYQHLKALLGWQGGEEVTKVLGLQVDVTYKEEASALSFSVLARPVIFIPVSLS